MNERELPPSAPSQEGLPFFQEAGDELPPLHEPKENAMIDLNLPSLKEALFEARELAKSWAPGECSAGDAWRALSINRRSSVTNPGCFYEALDDRSCVPDTNGIKVVMRLLERQIEILSLPRWSKTKKREKLLVQFEGLYDDAIEALEYSIEHDAKEKARNLAYDNRTKELEAEAKEVEETKTEDVPANLFALSLQGKIPKANKEVHEVRVGGIIYILPTKKNLEVAIQFENNYQDNRVTNNFTTDKLFPRAALVYSAVDYRPTGKYEAGHFFAKGYGIAPEALIGKIVWAKDNYFSGSTPKVGVVKKITQFNNSFRLTVENATSYLKENF